MTGNWHSGAPETIEQCVIHFGHPQIHLFSHISQTIEILGSGDIFTADISDWLHIGNVNDVNWSATKVNYVLQMHKHSDQSTGCKYIDETLSYLALEGWFSIDLAKGFNLQSAANKWWNTCRAYLLNLQNHLDVALFRPVPALIHHLRETHVLEVCRSIKLTSLRDASEVVGIPIFGQLFYTQIKEDWGHKVSGRVLRYDQNALCDSIFINLQNGLLYYHQPFRCPISGERLDLDC